MWQPNSCKRHKSRPDLRNVQHREHKKLEGGVFVFELEVLHPGNVRRIIVALSLRLDTICRDQDHRHGHNSFQVPCTMAMKFNKFDETFNWYAI